MNNAKTLEQKFGALSETEKQFIKIAFPLYYRYPDKITPNAKACIFESLEAYRLLSPNRKLQIIDIITNII